MYFCLFDFVLCLMSNVDSIWIMRSWLHPGRFCQTLFSVIATNAVYCGLCLQSGKMIIVLSNKTIPTRHVDLVQNRRNVICSPTQSNLVNQSMLCSLYLHIKTMYCSFLFVCIVVLCFCCVFLRIAYPILPVSLDCPFFALLECLSYM